MASMVACCRSTPLSLSINPYNNYNLSSLKPSPIFFSRSQTCPFLQTHSHFLKHNRLSSYAPLIKASTHAFYSIDTDKLPSHVRNRTLDAVDLCGRRVTVGDVAAKAGIKVDDAQKALQAVAADSGGYLDVSDKGDVLYIFPEDYRSKLTAKSIRIRYEPLVEKTKSVADRVVRFAFGAALVVSIVLVFAAIVVILVYNSDKIGNSDEDDDSDKDDEKKSRSKSSSSNLFFLDSSPSSFRWWDAHVPQVESNGMDFTQAVFSFVFGDGDPNQNFEEKRWKLIGQYIASTGGVTTAEELAPYLDVTTKAQKNDEGYILPVLIRFDGQPEVDEEGNILYQFPSLQRTASVDRRGKGHRNGIDKVVPKEKFLKENYWNFSITTTYQKVMVVGLAALNNLGVIILGGLLRDKEVTKIGFIKFVSYTYPLLQIYAVSYFVIPFFRGIFILKINADIKKRNQAREQHALGLEFPDVTLRRKLQNARDLAKRNFVGKDKVVYSTKGDSVDQTLEAEKWDQKLSRGKKSKVKEIIEIKKWKPIGNKNAVYSYGQDIDAKESGQKLLEMTEEFEKTD